MKRTFKITESQYEYLMSGKCLEENTAITDNNPNNDLTITKTNPTSADKSNPLNALKDTEKLAKQNNINTSDPDLKIGATADINGKETEVTTSMNENVISKEEILKKRVKFLRENSREVSFRNFIRKM